MLDIRLIREQPDFVKERLATRGGDDAAKIDQVLRSGCRPAESRDRAAAAQCRSQTPEQRDRREAQRAANRRTTWKTMCARSATEIAKLNERERLRRRTAAGAAAQHSESAARRRAHRQGGERQSGRAELGREAAARAEGARSRRARHAPEAVRSGTRGETERQRLHLLHRRGRTAGAGADQFHARPAHARARLHSK